MMNKSSYPMCPPLASSAHLLRSPPQLTPSKLSCVPLVWLPTWALNYAEYFIASISPISELLDAGLLTERVQLLPDLGHVLWWRRPKFISELAEALTGGPAGEARPVRLLRELAPRCTPPAAQWALAEGRNGSSRRCASRCFRKLIFCRFEDIFSPFKPPMAPHRAATRIAQALAARACPSTPPRGGGKGGGGKGNVTRHFHLHSVHLLIFIPRAIKKIK